MAQEGLHWTCMFDGFVTRGNVCFSAVAYSKGGDNINSCNMARSTTVYGCARECGVHMYLRWHIGKCGSRSTQRLIVY